MIKKVNARIMLPEARKTSVFTSCAGRIAVVKKSRPWYNRGTADSFGGKEVLRMHLVVTFIVSVAAGVIANYICKWWDGDHRL